MEDKTDEERAWDTSVETDRFEYKKFDLQF
jgi:hypothetical protein